MNSFTTRQRCAAQHFGAWAIEPRWFQNAIAAVKGGTWKAAADDDEADGEVAPAGPAYERVGTIAVISMRGYMTKGRSSFGGCSSVDTRRAVRDAVADWQVKGIMLVMDCPGGTVAGVADLAADVAAADAVKPVYTYAEDLCCSAAYWVASQSRAIYSNVTAMVGCIGTYTVLEDSTGAQAMEGIKWQVISTGRFKGLGADGKVTDDLVSDVQREVNELNAPFLAGVAAGRGFDAAGIALVSDGRTYVGVQAKALGLVDEVAAFDVAMSALSKESGPRVQRVRTPAVAGEAPMTATRRAELLGDSDAGRAIASTVSTSRMHELLGMSRKGQALLRKSSQE